MVAEQPRLGARAGGRHLERGGGTIGGWGVWGGVGAGGGGRHVNFISCAGDVTVSATSQSPRRQWVFHVEVDKVCSLLVCQCANLKSDFVDEVKSVTHPRIWRGRQSYRLAI